MFKNIKLFPKRTYTYLLDCGDGYDSTPIEVLPVWLNKNKVHNRIDGGVTGFFREFERIMPGVYLLKGEEYHGMITENSIVMEIEKIKNI